MMTVNEVSKLTGVTVRALQYYDRIGLLSPAAHTEAGYRLYDEEALAQLQQILLFRELEFPLKEIKRIMTADDYDRSRAVEQQIQLLTLKKEHIENLIAFARGIRLTGGNYMEFKAFDTSRIDEYAREARETWGQSAEYREFEAKSANRTKAEEKELGSQIMAIVAEFGVLKEKGAADPAVQAQVKKLQDFITANYYSCSDEILASLGQMYAAGGDFTANIDEAGGPGAAAFANEAIQACCAARK